jgi:hypothetical protein
LLRLDVIGIVARFATKLPDYLPEFTALNSSDRAQVIKSMPSNRFGDRGNA